MSSERDKKASCCTRPIMPFSSHLFEIKNSVAKSSNFQGAIFSRILLSEYNGENAMESEY